MRRLHRWVATFSVFFLLWVSLTGVALGVDAMWPPTGMDGPPPAAGPAEVTSWFDDIQLRLKLHNLLQDLHRGSIIGVPGQIIDVLTGFCLIFLSASGIVMYLDMLKQRRKTGQRSLIWGHGLNMRLAHRWTGSILSVFLTYLFVTGTATAIAQLLDPESAQPIPPPAEMQMPGADGAPPRRGPRPKRELTLAAFIQDLHSGSAIGRAAEWAMLLTGFASVVLTISGIWLYLTVRRRRLRNGHSQFFW